VALSYSATGSPALLSINSSSIVLGNFSADYYPNSNISIFNRFTVVAPSSSRAFTITAATFFSSGGSAYPIDSKTNSYSCLPGGLTPAAVAVTNSSLGATTALILSITLEHALSAGCYLGVAFPAELAVVGNSSCSSNNSLVSCSLSNGSYGNLSVSGAVAGSTVLLITFSAVNNPPEGLTTASFAVASYIDSALDGIIDQLTSGLTLTYGANQLPNGSFQALPSNTTTFAPSNYTLSATLVDPIPAGGSIRLVFPPAVTLGSPSLLSASFPTATCSLTQSGSAITLSGCFASALNTLAIWVVIGGATNPSSLAPTASFQLYTLGTLGTVNYRNDSVTVTMSTPAISVAFSVTPGSLVVGSSTTYTFALSFYGTHSSGEHLMLSLPDGMAVVGTPVCTALSGIASVACSSANASNLQIDLTAMPTNAISFSASSLQNYQVSSTLVSLQLVAYSAANYASEHTSAASLSFTAATLAVSVSHDQQLALNEASSITLTVTAPFALSSTLSVSLTTLQIGLPAEIAPLANTSCSVSTLSCAIAGSTFTVSSVGLSLSGLAVTLSNILPTFSASSSSFSLSYSYGGKAVAAVGAGVVATVYCTSPCQRCQGSPSSCQSCLPAPNTLTLFLASNSSCLAVCPGGYYASGSLCLACPASCTACSSSSNCSSCAPSFILQNSSCNGNCPNGTYLNSGNCSACDPVCATCSSSASSCLSCSSGLLILNGQCYSNCPQGYQADAGSSSCVTKSTKSTTTLVALYYPSSLVTAALLLIVLAAKGAAPASDVIGNAVAVLSVGSLASLAVLTSTALTD
jgi:hypothetical protein